MLQLITPTGDRPKAWELCQFYMDRQNYAGDVAWHVVDDGRCASGLTLDRWPVHLYRLPPMEGNSQARNLAFLLTVIDPAHPVVVIEDDDWYAPTWLQTVSGWLETAELVGESHARYFNVATGRGHALRNSQHASLCSTACRGAGIAAFREAIKRRSTYIDIDLWRAGVSKSLHETKLVVGIKGLPGRGGIGAGHRPTFGQPMNLRDWIGEDAALYA